jgi:hypothetical protein
MDEWRGMGYNNIRKGTVLLALYRIQNIKENNQIFRE